ncbi:MULTISPECIES: S41 family peptidase [Sphingomonas]|uniref:S41 family peptidase n=1 Tax=Sphingomonas TaxID=13687 RepID=UPI000F7D940D|nr:S41 family peptidase [Sphingomonas sp. ABOLF]RSV10437.1 peptidase S41 [Sphingomonas sp. ABOLF]
MMKHSRCGLALSVLALLSACGGNDGGVLGGSVTTPAPSPTPTPTPTPTQTAGCSLRERQDWAAAQLNEWYLFPETLPARLDPTPYASVDAYVDALTATARAQGRDRFFTYRTSIAEEDAYYEAGSSAGYGFRLGLTSDGRLFVTEAFEDAPALAAGIDRGTEIVAIGTSTGTLRTVASLMSSGGTDALDEALGASAAGTRRVMQVRDASGTRNVTVAMADFELQPVSNRYGAKVLNDGGRRVGYLNLRTFINTADPQLRQAFASFRAQGVTELVVDLRYNGGGLISIAELMGDLMGANRRTSEVFTKVSFRASKSENDEARTFAPQPQSIAPTRVAFIGTGGTASASEMVINGFVPYLGTGIALVGTNTYGKPVGQIALDRSACDDRLRVVALAVQNADGNANYYNGLANTVPATCEAPDDISYPLGDPREASLRQALDFLAGRSCSPILGMAATASGQRTAGLGRAPERQLLRPARPTPAQREVPGLF